jgi:Leucine-rich repeat (LRR) protein
MSLSLMSTALIPYTPPKTPMEFLQSEFEKFQQKQLVDLIHTKACHIGSIDNSRITFWVKKDCTVEKIRTCSYLRLYQAELDEVPDSIRQLTWLDTIDLANNRLKTLPRWIGELSHLCNLNLGRNRIQELPNEITYLNNLEEINLYDNKLDTIPPQVFRIKSLRKLYLDDNKIKAIPPEIGQLKNLEFLSIVQNGLVTIPKEIKELKSLTTFCCLYDNTLDEASTEISQGLGNIVKG